MANSRPRLHDDVVPGAVPIFGRPVALCHINHRAFGECSPLDVGGPAGERRGSPPLMDVC